MSTNRLNELVRGKRGVTADTALRLSRLMGTSPELWLNLQWHSPSGTPIRQNDVAAPPDGPQKEPRP